MIAAIKQKVIVGQGGKVELLRPDLVEGTLVEVIVLVELEEHDRQDFVQLPLGERRRLLAQQAQQLMTHYEQTASERDEWQAGDFVER